MFKFLFTILFTSITFTASATTLKSNQFTVSVVVKENSKKPSTQETTKKAETTSQKTTVSIKYE